MPNENIPNIDPDEWRQKLQEAFDSGKPERMWSILADATRRGRARLTDTAPTFRWHEETETERDAAILRSLGIKP